MNFLNLRTLSLNDKKEILELWNNEYPQDIKYQNIEEFEKYLRDLKDQSHILIKDENEKITGWYFDFMRDGERWFAMILNSEFQGIKLGTELLDHAKRERKKLNGWVISSNDYLKLNAKPYSSPIGFYKKNGFAVYYDIKLKTKKISAVKISWSADL